MRAQLAASIILHSGVSHKRTTGGAVRVASWTVFMIIQ
jgi:hypothetical protein